MKPMTTIVPMVAAVVMVAPAQDAVNEAEVVEKVLAMMSADGVLEKADGDVSVSARQRVMELRAHAALVKAGKEAVKDFPWLLKMLEIYYDADNDEDLHAPVEAVKLLLAAGADVNARNKSGRTPIFYHNASAEVARALLDAGADVNAADEDGNTPIFRALSKKSIPVLDMLLEAGADLNVQDKCGNTPLYDNMCCGSEEVSRHLIAAGADVNIRNKEGKSPVDKALEENNADLLMEMIHAGAQVDGSKYSPFLLACFFGQVDECRRLIDEGADVNEVFAGRSTPLMVAARSGNVELCRLLIEAGADGDAEVDGGGTALHLAAAANRPAVCTALLEAGVDLEARWEQGFTPLACAVEAGSEEAVDVLIKAGAKLNTRCDSNPIIFLTCRWGSDDAAMLRKLIAAGADIKMTKRGKLTNILHHAAASGAKEVCKVALEAGGDINSLDVDGYTPLHHAAKDREVEMVKLLLEAGADVNAGAGCIELLSQFSYSADNKKVMEIVNILVDQNLEFPTNKRRTMRVFNRWFSEREFGVCRKLLAKGLTLRDWTPLAQAAVFGEADEVKALLEGGAAVDGKSSGGYTPLTLAAYAGRVDICRILLDAGADVNAMERRLWTPLVSAVAADNTELVKMLLAAGAKVKAQTPAEDEPEEWRYLLSIAAASGNVEMCRALLDAGADVNAADQSYYYYRSPLVFALVAKKNAEEITRMFIAAGANVNAQNDEGDTPLHVLLRSDKELTLDSTPCRMLIEAGADLTIKNKKQKTPEDILEDKERWYPISLPSFKISL